MRIGLVSWIGKYYNGKLFIQKPEQYQIIIKRISAALKKETNLRMKEAC